MVVSRVDQAELLTVLHSGDGTSPFAIFLDRLRRRTGAGGTMLAERRGGGEWSAWRALAPGSEAPAGLTRDVLTTLRPGRVYAFEEIDLADEAGRVVRSTGVSGDRWLVAHGGLGLSAADSALLSGLAPHVAIACDNRAKVDGVRVELAAAQAALARCGVAWALLDGAGRPVAGAALPVSARDRATLAAAMARGAQVGIAGDAIGLRAPATDGSGDDGTLLLARVATHPIDRARVFAATHRVAASEARLAIAIAEGASIARAAAALGITVETARFYSKRLYAATGSKGQADLVRLVWTGLAALG